MNHRRLELEVRKQTPLKNPYLEATALTINSLPDKGFFFLKQQLWSV
jgi:hypothetical protein